MNLLLKNKLIRNDKALFKCVHNKQKKQTEAIYLSVYLSIYLYLFLHLSNYLSIYFQIYLYIIQSKYLTIFSSYPFIYPSIYVSIYLSIYPSIYLSIYLSMYPSIYLSIYLVCLSISLIKCEYNRSGNKIYLKNILTSHPIQPILNPIYLSIKSIYLSICLPSIYLSSMFFTFIFLSLNQYFMFLYIYP